MAGEGWDLTPQRYEPKSGVEVKQDGTGFDVPAWRETFVPSGRYRIHQGQAFSTHHNNSSFQDGEIISIKMNTGASEVHISVDASGKFDFDFEILEESTSSGGTAEVPFNRLRTSPTTSGTTLFIDPTIITEGTIISSDVVSEGQKLGGSVDFGAEWILKTGTEYIFRLTSRANSNKAHINLTWYEPN